MRLTKSIRRDAARLRCETAAEVKAWRTVLYDSGWPCNPDLSPGDRLELSQVERRLALLEAAATLLDRATR